VYLIGNPRSPHLQSAGPHQISHFGSYNEVLPCGSPFMISPTASAGLRLTEKTYGFPHHSFEGIAEVAISAIVTDAPACTHCCVILVATAWSGPVIPCGH
jgi:hypothetical protein